MFWQIPFSILVSILIFFLFRLIYSKKRKSLKILVLGEIRQSPRTLKNAEILAKLFPDFQIDLIGTSKSENFEDLKTKFENLNFHLFKPFKFRNFSPLFNFVLKISYEIFWLFFFFFKTDLSVFVLVQSPPCVHFLFLVKAYTVLTNSSLILDVHNLSFTIFSLKYKQQFLFEIFKFFEFFSIKISDRQIVVSKALQKFLMEKINVKIPPLVLYDRPFKDHHPGGGCYSRRQKNDKNCLRLFSSTSWTPDEPMEILLNCLEKFENFEKKVVLTITGRGPLRDKFFRDFYRKKLDKFCTLRLLWFEKIADYFEELKRADVALCFHKSSSGLDLPMKLVDFLQAEIPSICFNYKTLTDEYPEGLFLTFKNETDLFDGILRISKDSTEMKKNIRKFKEENEMEENFRNVMGKFLKENFQMEFQRCESDGK